MAWKRATDLGPRLRDAREAWGRLLGQEVTQEAFGDLYGVTGQSVSDAERGESRPPRSSLVRLAGRLGISVEAFAEGGPMPSTLLIRPGETRTAGESGSGKGEQRAVVPAVQHQVDAAQEMMAELQRSGELSAKAFRLILVRFQQIEDEVSRRGAAPPPGQTP